ncbi:hypothetical protein Ddye_024755 [Dipteronia dyeriana]|uniref:Uncharacterized protein n=1 Tax=Dipteronia dyeriana TaxID=168575 RepID=A0AAD9WUJ5_9ROSI|nr:hypothetical protein Ddye_024755 [Dipteronia dyeriana]
MEVLRKNPKLLGPVDKFVNPINPDSSVSRKTMKQQSFTAIILKEKIYDTQRYVVKWVYQAGIPFNVIDNDCFLQMVGDDWSIWTELQTSKSMKIEETTCEHSVAD